MLEWFGQMADQVLLFGYFGVYIALIVEGLGLPFPGDAVMAFYGFSAARGELHIGGILLFSILGYCTGTTIAYMLSRRFGREWLDRIANKLMFNRRSMLRTTGMIDRYGPWLLVPGRFLPGVRSVSSYVAGALDMDFRDFLLYTVIGATLWCAGWVGVGYWFGGHLAVVIDMIQSGLAYLTGAVLVTLLGFWLYRRKVRP